MALQSRLKKLGRESVMRLVKVPAYSVIVDDGDTFRAGPAWSDDDVQNMSAVNTVRCHVHFVKKGYSLPDAVHKFSNFKPSFLKPLSSSTKKGLQSMLPEAYSDILPAQGDAAENFPAPRQCSNQDQASPAAPVGPT